ETRLQQLEAGLAEVRRGHQAVTQQLAHTQAAVEQQVDMVKGDLSTFAVEFRAQLQANAESQRVAQVAHQQQFQQGLDEIKALLASSPRPRAPPAAKRPADDGHGKMELDNEPFTQDLHCQQLEPMCSLQARPRQMFHTGSGRAMLRSYALGVATFSKLPCRPPLQDLPAEMLSSCRIAECFVRLHGFEVKIISVYGVPRCLPSAAEKNNLLLAWAFQRATVSCVPALVAGDFNTSPTELPSWQAFADLGWIELGAFAAQCHDVHLPCTCKGATRFDTFLLPPCLYQYFQSADVLTDSHLFDSHAPMRLRLQLPSRGVPRWIWRLPQSFADLVDKPQALSPAYQASSQQVRLAFGPEVPETCEGDKLRLWSATVEAAVSDVLHNAHLTDPARNRLKALPKRHRGRCRETVRQQAAPPHLPRPGRQGDPEAFDEDTSVLGRQRLRQWRRLHTFLQGLTKFQADRFRGPLAPDGWPCSLHLEWRAICRAAGYGISFSDWVLQWPCFVFFPTERPNLDYVRDLTSFVRFDVEALQRQNVAVKAKLFKFRLHVDAKDFGAARSFVRVKPAQNPPFTCVRHSSEQQVTLKDRHNYHLCTFAARHERWLELHSQVFYAQVPGQVTQVSPGAVTVLFDTADDCVLPATGRLCRYQQDSSWQGVVGSLMEFWSPIWNRDSSQQEADIAAWPKFQQLLQTCGQPGFEVPVDLLAVDAWQHVARKLSPRKARGICGWHNAELRILPRAALSDLAFILHHMSPSGFPASLLKARVAVLSKVAAPSHAAQARPITVLSCIYRLWARVLCTQVLAVWSSKLPPAISGCLRGRSALDLAYAVQAEIEACLLYQEDLSGLSLDLRKAFNYLPRAPICQLLQHLGVPPHVCHFWQKSLAKVCRTFQINQSLGPDLPSTTGAPEGDPTSVLAMIAVCWCFVSLLQGLVQPRAYVDNWSWTADAPDNHGPALLILQDLTESLSLQVDWAKTYVWALQNSSKSWWRAHSSTFVPSGVQLTLVDQVQELGSLFTFGRRTCSGAFGGKCQAALGRLQSLASDPQGLPVRAKIVQSGIWPFLFYGTEACLPSRSTISNLRSSAARAVVGDHKTLSAWAALCFSPGVQDPEVFLLCHHLSQLRRCFAIDPATAETVWSQVAGTVSIPDRAVCGPAGSLQNLLHRNGWTFHISGTCRGPLHQAFNIRLTSIKGIRSAVCAAWADTVHDNICHRNGLRFAPMPCPSETQKVFAKFRPWELKFLAKHYSGGFMSGAERNTWSREDTEFCPLCSAVDSKAHRLYKCPALFEQRAAHQDTLDWVQEHRPHWTHLAYVAWPDEASLLQLLLRQMGPPALPPPPAPVDCLCLFTDGSALQTNNVMGRLTAWAVVAAPRPSNAPEIQPWQLEPSRLVASFAIVAQGSPAGAQTVPRAELAAIAWANNWCAQCPEQVVELYSDCQSAIDLWTDWTVAGWDAISRRCNADLLQHAVPRANLCVYKVKAHRQQAELADMTAWEQWLTAGNEAADSAAKAACSNIPSLVQDTARRVAAVSSTDSRYLYAFCKAILAIGPVDAQLRSAVRTRVQQESDEQQWSSLAVFLERIREWRIPSPGSSSLPDIWEENWVGWTFGPRYGAKLLAWIEQLRWPTAPVEPQHDHHISYFELLLSFVTTMSVVPIVEDSASPGRYLPVTTANHRLRHVTLRMLTECFRASLKRLGSQLDCDLLRFTEVTDITYMRLLHIPAPCPGLSGRPQLPGSAWFELLQDVVAAELPVLRLITRCADFEVA
ncbi:unnamed protein product, partial [Symbiodinium sp. CCMP2456]